MRPKLLANLILLAVLAVLAGVALFEPGKEEPKTVYLTDIDPDTLERFELDNGEKQVFEKQGEHWQLSAPFKAPANDIRIHQLLAIAKAESRARYPLKPGDLARFELDKPKAVLTLGQTRLVFGGLEPIDMLRYVQIGDTLHLVADDFSHHFAAKAADYVDKKLLPEDAQIQEIRLPGLSAKRGGKGLWTMEPPGDTPAMAELANAWQSARAIAVQRHEQAVQGETIHIGLGAGQAVDYVILQREPDLLLLRPDWKLEYLVTADSGKRLLALQKPGAENDSDKGQEDEEAPPGDSPPGETTDYDPAEDADGNANVDGE